MNRNRIAVVLGSLFTLALVAGFAAPAAAGPMALNPQAGMTWSNYSFDDDESIDDKARVGYALGGTLRFGDRIYVAPGLYYQQTGFEATATDDLTLETVTDAVGVNAVHVPVYVGIAMTGGGFRFYGGPAVTVITSVSDNAFGLEKDDFESSIFGGVLGAGMDLTKITFDLNYEIGMSDVFKDAGDTGAKQNVLRGLVGIKF